MANDNGYEIASVNPGWIHKQKDEKYLDTEFIRIFMFFVVNTPLYRSKFKRNRLEGVWVGKRSVEK